MTPPGLTPPGLTPPGGIGLDRLFDHPTQRWPDKQALIDDAGSVSFREVSDHAARLAAVFAALGLAPGERVALILPNGIPFIVTEIAIARRALVKVPLNIRFHRDEVLYALADCRPAVLVCTAAYAAAALALQADIPSLRRIVTVGGAAEHCLSYETAIAPGQPVAESVRHDPDAAALIRYTGGTTGRPKGIVHTARSLVDIALDSIRELRYAETDIALHLGHLAHGLNFSWPAYFAAGATQILRERFDPARVLADIAAHRVTCTYMVPTMVQRLLDHDDGTADVSSLRQFMYSSAPMPVPLLRRALARYGRIFIQNYTLSESPVVTTLLQPHEHVERETLCGPRLASCGREILTMEIEIRDADGRRVAPGEPGEICVRSANNMAGYWNLPEETARSLIDGWVLTGDVGRRDEDGFLYLVDRKKDVIITGGFNVYPKEVEDVLYRHRAVAQCAVIGIPDEEWGEAIKAFVVTAPGAAVTAAELVQLCRDHLADFKRPRHVAFVADLPLSPVGKIMRRALRLPSPSGTR